MAPGTNGGAIDLDIAEVGPGPVLRIAYRRQLIRALNVKLRKGEISQKDYRRIRRSSYAQRFIDGFIDEIDHAAKVAGEWVDDIQVWLKMVTDWIVENWELVLRIILSLLILL